jgi:hypothetical protein
MKHVSDVNVSLSHARACTMRTCANTHNKSSRLEGDNGSGVLSCHHVALDQD